MHEAPGRSALSVVLNAPYWHTSLPGACRARLVAAYLGQSWALRVATKAMAYRMTHLSFRYRVEAVRTQSLHTEPAAEAARSQVASVQLRPASGIERR